MQTKSASGVRRFLHRSKKCLDFALLFQALAPGDCCHCAVERREAARAVLGIERACRCRRGNGVGADRADEFVERGAGDTVTVRYVGKAVCS